MVSRIKFFVFIFSYWDTGCASRERASGQLQAKGWNSGVGNDGGRKIINHSSKKSWRKLSSKKTCVREGQRNASRASTRKIQLPLNNLIHCTLLSIQYYSVHTAFHFSIHFCSFFSSVSSTLFFFFFFFIFYFFF